MTSTWERYGRLLVERAALSARRHGPTSGVLTRAEASVLTGGGEELGGSVDDVREAFRPLLDDARGAFLDELADPELDAPFARIVRYVGAEEPDATVLALVAAVELDDEVAALVAGLRSDGGSGFSIALLRSIAGDLAVRTVADDALLRRAALLDVDPRGPLGAAAVRLTRRTAWALLGDVSLDVDLPPDTDVVLADVATGGERVLVTGPDRARRVAAAAEATRGVGFLLAAPPADEHAWVALVAQATVAGVGLVLDVPAPTSEAPAPLGPTSRRWLERALHLPVAVCCPVPLPLALLPPQGWVEATPLAPGITDAEWAEAYGATPVPPRRPAADQLLALGVLDPSREPASAMRRLAASALHTHARRVEPHATWDDLVLPPGQEARLRGLVDRYRFRARVHDDWGMSLYPSPGVVALFTGPSGTGKTTSAEVIAGELGIELFRVDLSALVSKYIGETEKNLEEIFSAANAGDYLLLFDEADSLFGQRSAVSDARDRYANMEVSYLLQRLETYDGFVVLTSNFQGNIDDAFLRRIHGAVSFPLPSADDRVRIWERSLADAPRGDVDLAFVATFELSGGSIRNAALTAAFLAASRGVDVGMVELLEGVAQELGKLRQRVTADLFGPWAAQVFPSGAPGALRRG